MSSIQISEEHIGDAILHLIEQKSKRDGATFSKRALAEAIGVNISMISRTTNEDLSKRSIPNIPLLIKVVQFFKDDGFNITIDDLLNFQPNKLYFNRHGSNQLNSFGCDLDYEWGAHKRKRVKSWGSDQSLNLTSHPESIYAEAPLSRTAAIHC